MKVRGSGGITTTIRQTLDRVVVQDEVGLELNLVILDTQCPLLGTLHTYAGQGTADWGQQFLLTVGQFLLNATTQSHSIYNPWQKK